MYLNNVPTGNILAGTGSALIWSDLTTQAMIDWTYILTISSDGEILGEERFVRE